VFIFITRIPWLFLFFIAVINFKYLLDPVPSTSTGRRNFTSPPPESRKNPKRLQIKKRVDHFEKEKKEERRKLFQSKNKGIFQIFTFFKNPNLLSFSQLLINLRRKYDAWQRDAPVIHLSSQLTRKYWKNRTLGEDSLFFRSGRQKHREA
jgi:hypothetical protein